MNKIVFTLVVPGNSTMSRMHEMGNLIGSSVRAQMKTLREEGKLTEGEVLIGDPGYAIVLSLSEDRRAQNNAPINKNVGVGKPKKGKVVAA